MTSCPAQHCFLKLEVIFTTPISALRGQCRFSTHTYSSRDSLEAFTGVPSVPSRGGDFVTFTIFYAAQFEQTSMFRKHKLWQYLLAKVYILHIVNNLDFADCSKEFIVLGFLSFLLREKSQMSKPNVHHIRSKLTASC